MKKLCLIIAMLTLAMTVSAKVVFLNMRNDGNTKPSVHLWDSNNQEENSWNSDAEKMKLVATGNGNSIYVNIFSKDNVGAKFHVNGSNDFSGDLSFYGSTPFFTRENDQIGNPTGVKVCLYTNMIKDGNPWPSYDLDYVSDGKFQTNLPLTIDNSEGKFLISISDANGTNTAFMYAPNSNTEMNDGALKVTLSATGTEGNDVKANLHGKYNFVLDLADMSLTAVKEGGLQPVTDMNITPSVTTEKFYQKMLPLVLTPTTNVARWSYTINGGNRRGFNGNAAQTIELGEGDDYGTTYTIDVTLTDAEGKNQTKSFTYEKNVDLAKWVTNGNYYYFYGDMNFWSILGDENRDGEIHSYQDRTTGEGKKIEEVYREADNMAAENPHRKDRYGSMQEMIENWRFQSVGAASNLPAGITGEDRTDNWLVFDLSKVTHVDRSHADGHLCGQFKIVPGFLDSEGTKVAAGLNGAIAPNTLYQSATGNTGGANFSLKRNVYQNAKIYFNPSTVKVYIETTTKDNTGANVETADLSGDIYLYYWNKTTNQRPASITINEGSQYNYTTESTTYLTPENMVQVPDGTTFTSNGQQYTSNGNIYRIRLPHSTEHRSPIAFTATITSQSGASVEREIRCQDIWLVEGQEAKVSFAVASCDESVCNTKVTYSLKAPKYVNNQLVGYEYVFENVTMQWDAEQGKFVGNRNIPAQYLSGSIVEFRNAFGETVEVDVNGQETVEGTFNCETGETELLYTHLKGSYVLGNQHGLQIEAEMFEDENTINTSFSDVDYTFYVYDYLGNEVLKSGPSTAPFCEWTPAEAGYYNIKVECENKITGATAVGYDVYPVYEAAAKASAPVQNKAATGNITVKVDTKNVSGWGTPCIYYWGGSSTPEWDESPTMTHVSGTVYEYSIPANTTGMLFRNAAKDQQSTDCEVVAGETIVLQSDMSVKFQSARNYTIYFDKSSTNWSGVNIWAWNTKNDEQNFTGGSWPGIAMTSDAATGYYKYEFTTDNACHKTLLFNNTSDNGATSGNKTEDLNLVNGHVYKADGSHTEYVDIPDPEKLIPKNPNPEFYLSEMKDLGGGELYVGNTFWGKYHTHLSLTAEEGAHQTGVHQKVNYSWAKFEDWISGTSSYDDIVSGGKTKAEWSDNHLVSGNTESHHYCMNWHPAYYRVYKTSETENLRTAVSGSQGNVHRTHATRVARTVPVTKVSGTTTGVEDIATDNAQDSSAPVEYYNINGQKVSGESLVPGVYIRRQGHTATKVYVK